MNGGALVAVVMGSDSDYPVMEGASAKLTELAIPYSITVVSAHRSPRRLELFSRDARSRGFEVIIAGAGGSAHLAGALAAWSTLPVIGVPIDSSPLHGFDALLSMAQMPAGTPVATMAVGKAGARNAAILAAQILSIKYPEIEKTIERHKRGLEETVSAQVERVREWDKEMKESSQ